ncbi:MAG: putative DNA binding domain-containing protein [Magnetococcales bacterium]|nr:putative DNA binding domain-containing protein [Magnetococcales bacterium]
MATTIDLDALAEGWECEAKTALGREGRGQVPASVWETYSALANTDGGVILLGVREKPDGTLHPVGIPDIDRVERDFWNQVSDPDKVSRNLLGPRDVERHSQEGCAFLLIRVPRADRRQRPIFINGNPLRGTFLRRQEGDRRASGEEVRRLMAEAEERPRDEEILDGFGLEDLDRDSLMSFRHLFGSQSPGHPFLAGDDREMLRQLGGWGDERGKARTGPTLAGLLMFGRQRAILDRLPAFHLDYQQLPEPTDPAGTRWVDRVTIDGTWSGNLFEFYRKVVLRLRDGLRIPFRLGPDLLRRDDTPQHEALREALVNTLIHAEHGGGGGVRIRRGPDRFEFVNPGTLRMPLEQVRMGGRSDCRNPALQRMFQMIGAGEKAGSGFPRILHAWREQHWRAPLLEEHRELHETRLTLTTLSLFPPAILEKLERCFPGRLAAWNQEGRLALATALLEGRITNNRLQELTDRHPNDLTEILQRLVRDGALEPHGKQRWTWYTVRPEETSSEGLPVSSEGLPVSSEGLPVSSEGLPASSEGLPASSEGLPMELLEQSEAVRGRGKVDGEQMRGLILALCRERPHTPHSLGKLLGRSSDYLRTTYLRALVQSGQLEPLYSGKPTHPRQAYRARDDASGMDRHAVAGRLATPPA